MREFEHAVELHRQGRTAEAEILCRQILAVEPKHPRTLHLLGAIRFAGGEKAAAIGLLRDALAAKADYPEAHFNLAAMLADSGDDAAAADEYRRVTELKPEDAEAWARLGAVLMNLDRGAESETAFRRALQLRPDDGPVLAGLASILLARGDSQAAVEYGRRAAIRLPDSAEIQIRLGLALMEQGLSDEALECYRRARKLAPESPAAASELAAAHLARGEVEQAIVLFREAVRLAPGDAKERRPLLGALLYSPTVSPDERFTSHEEFGRVALARVTAPLPPPTNDRDPERTLRIGWLSSDLRDHPVARNLEPFFAHRNRDRFETVVYAELLRPNAATDWFRRHSDLWRPIGGLPDSDVAALIRSDAIDIMIFVAGRFDHNRPQVAAWRPAPVQVSLFDAATSGLSTMDYFIADSIMVPRRTSERFVERVLRLPNFVVQPPISSTGPPEPPPSVRRGYVTFGSFNNPAKLNHEVLTTWAELLHRVPKSRLYLKYRRQFRSTGLRDRICRDLGSDAASRVEFDFVERPTEEHLKGYAKIDIALDPFPFTGSTTTFEALWMGVPVVSLLGQTLMARWTPAMLKKVGLTEMIADSRDSYVDIAARLAGDPERLAGLRASLRGQVAASPICAGARATRHFERVLRATWRRYCSTSR